MILQYAIYAYALVFSFLLGTLLTEIVRRLALRWEVYDHPGERKVHREPIPLMGGVAIVATFYCIILVHLALIAFSQRLGANWLSDNLAAILGSDHRVKLAGIFAGGFLIFLLGLVDDLRNLSPWIKLLGQVTAALVLVLSDVCLDLFVLTDYPVLAALATIFWVVLMTNSLNFLDNMDGLCGGISVIAAFSFFLSVQPYHDELVRFLLMVFAGSVAGFLYHNLTPARIFMGDAGSMFNGYILATVAVVGTFHIENTPSSRLAMAAPLLALSVPLFDTVTVVLIRLKNRQNIMLGDKRHFSHRLVELGMTHRQAVGFIFLVAGVVGAGGALLHSADHIGTLIILAQTTGVFMLIVLLMRAHSRRDGE